ncbi:uncharacterized protein LOC123530129 isoform X2 [Mercenaria mercenaria]|uniref:uncharacterized protein LOC123530129 isoform X2 n=1 Tax=Mercenaria mercenaria TaxID=6596 RepID=UPI00234E78A2|nr:uncharacterized protein LOC123530129 isoform X2 [Mercenaria mercenaria]
MLRDEKFFERQKFATAHSFASKTPAQTKRGLSQDLIALHTVSRVYSGVPDGTKKRRTIKKVDLEKFRSCTHQIDEVDMGPCSPSQTPSKLLLSDGKLEKNSGCVKSTGNPMPSRELFPRGKHIHRNCIHKSSMDAEQEEQNWEKNSKTGLINVESKVNDDDTVCKLSKEFSFSKPKPDGCYKNNTIKAKLDPYVSEDFQVTPLVRYVKKRSPENMEFDKYKKKRHSEGTNIRKEKTSYKTEKKTYHFLKEPYFSSTPVTDLHADINDKNKIREHFGGISPITKGVTFSNDVESGFRFKPRPMIVTSYKKCDKSGAPQCHVQERNVNEIEEQMNSDSSCGFTQRGDGSSRDVCNKKKVFEYNHGKLSRSLCNLNNCRKNQMSMPVDGLKTQSTQFDSLSKYGLTENTFDNSLPGDSLSAVHEITGALAKYRNIFRHKNNHESPFLNSDRDSVKGQDEINKTIGVDNRDEHGISKPDFPDLEEEFQYKPMKTGSEKMAKEIMSICQKFEKGTENGIGNRESHMLDNTKSAAMRLSSGSVRSYSSPVPVGEFPEHLLSPSTQLQDKINQKLSEIIADERRSGLGNYISRQTESSSQDYGAGSYKPLKPCVGDVLNEMKELEEEDSMSPDVVLDEVQKTTTTDNLGTITTESFEADAFFESEEVLLNADTEQMQDLEEQSNIQTPLAVEKDFNVIDHETNRFKSEKEVENNNNITLNKTLEADTKVGAKVDSTLDACLESCEMIDKNSKSGKINHDFSSQVNDVRSQELETNSNELGKELSRNIYGIEDGILERNNVTNISDENIDIENDYNIGKSGSEDENCEKNNAANICDKNLDNESEGIGKSGSDLNMVKKIKCSENNSQNVEICCVADKSETYKTIQLQVPEISSGKNQFTQTVGESSLQKSYVEVSTSPFLELNTVQEVTDVGVQCDLASFPTLSCLAGKCYKVKPIKSSTSLHKDPEKKDYSSSTDTKPENVSAAQN